MTWHRIIGSIEASEIAKQTSPGAAKARMIPGEEGNTMPTERIQISVKCDPKIASKARDCVYGTPGLTLARLVEVALIAEVARREATRGEPFCARPRDNLRRGRPATALARHAEESSV